LLRAQRQIDIHSFADHEHAVIRGKDFLRSVRSLYRYAVQHGSPKDYLFGRLDSKTDADRGIGKNRRTFHAALRKFGTDSE